MPFNLLKKYPELLELDHLDQQKRQKSLYGIFKRDVEDNSSLNFRKKKIWPTKSDMPAMETLFHHLITEVVEETNPNGSTYKRRTYEPDRSKRLHWVKFHIEENKTTNMEIFSVEERINNSDIIRTYIFDKEQKYVIVLEPQRSGIDYYLITAYYLNEKHGEKAIQKRLNKRLAGVL